MSTQILTLADVTLETNLSDLSLPTTYTSTEPLIYSTSINDVSQGAPTLATLDFSFPEPVEIKLASFAGSINVSSSGSISFVDGTPSVYVGISFSPEGPPWGDQQIFFSDYYTGQPEFEGVHVPVPFDEGVLCRSFTIFGGSNGQYYGSNLSFGLEIVLNSLSIFYVAPPPSNFWQGFNLTRESAL